MLKLTIKKGKPQASKPSDYLKAMKKWDYIVTSKAIANRFHPAAWHMKIKITTQTLANGKVKVTKL